MGLPKVVLVLAVTLFVTSVLGSLAALGVSYYYDVGFWHVFEVGPVLKIAAVLLSGFVVSSGLLFVHYRSQESYMTFESIFFLVLWFLSLLNLLWIL
jgi:uncharacterized membrane protein YbhN (UPF0104 family)